MKNGHANGAGNGHDEPPRKTNITSLEEVRKRAEAEAKAKMRAARGPSYARDLVIGALIIAMALGMIWHWVSPLTGAIGGAR
jgi:hypothetical protein